MPEESPQKKEPLRIKPDTIKITSFVKLFDDPLRPIAPLKLTEKSAISERLRQQSESAGS